MSANAERPSSSILKKNHEIEKKEKRSKSGNHDYQLHSETKVKSDRHDQNDFKYRQFSFQGKILQILLLCQFFFMLSFIIAFYWKH